MLHVIHLIWNLIYDYLGLIIDIRWAIILIDHLVIGNHIHLLLLDRNTIWIEYLLLTNDFHILSLILKVNWRSNMLIHVNSPRTILFILLLLIHSHTALKILIHIIEILFVLLWGWDVQMKEISFIKMTFKFFTLRYALSWWRTAISERLLLLIFWVLD